uniref:Cerebellin 20 n=1 Tax=Scophthalmus maximus TaxID=52904 RepID=A0A8D3D7M6_SCOMX
CPPSTAFVLLCLLHGPSDVELAPGSGEELWLRSWKVSDARSNDAQQRRAAAKGAGQELSLQRRCISNLASLRRPSPAGRAAFSVSLLKDGGFRCIGPFGGDEVVIYEHVFLNLGGHYNGSTGVFTVPQAGLYTFAVTLHSDAGAPRSPLAACTGLQVNGRVAAEAREQNADDQEDSATAVVLLQLNAGDAVAVKLLKGCFLCDESHYNTFSKTHKSTM